MALKILLLHIVSSRHQMGGAEQVFFSLAKFLKDDKEIVLACALNESDLLEKLKEIDIKIYKIPSKTLIFLPYIVLALKKIIYKFNPNIVHSHHRYTTFIMDHFFKQKTKIIHTAHIEMFDKTLISSFGHHTVAVSNAVKKNLIDRYKSNASMISVIYNGVEIKNPNKEKKELLEREFQLNSDKIIIGSIGRLEVQKGHKYLIDAISLLPAKYKDMITILIVGEGRLRYKLEAQVKEKNLKDIFIFFGYRNEIPELISLCDFTILPSLWEGFPLVAVESYFLKKPVIATNVSGIPEIILDKKTGLLVPPKDSQKLADAIITFIENTDLVKQYGELGYKYVNNNFAVINMCSQYKKLYSEIL